MSQTHSWLVLLHQKLDELREKEVLALTEAVKSLTQLLQQRSVAKGPKL